MTQYPKKYHGFKVIKKTDRTLHDYAGMNYWAAKTLGMKHGPKRNEIWVDESLPPRTVRKNMAHEVAEYKIMNHQKHKDYWCAHNLALQDEKKIRGRK